MEKSELREIHVFSTDGRGNPYWRVVERLTEVKKGELFRMFEQDGTQVKDFMTGKFEWIARCDGYLDARGTGTIEV